MVAIASCSSKRAVYEFRADSGLRNLADIAINTPEMIGERTLSGTLDEARERAVAEVFMTKTRVFDSEHEISATPVGSRPFGHMTR